MSSNGEALDLKYGPWISVKGFSWLSLLSENSIKWCETYSILFYVTATNLQHTISCLKRLSGGGLFRKQIALSMLMEFFRSIKKTK